MDKIPSEVSAKGKNVLPFCDRPLCDACKIKWYNFLYLSELSKISQYLFLGLNENVVSFAWVSKNSFVVGLATRHIKLYDISGNFFEINTLYCFLQFFNVYAPQSAIHSLRIFGPFDNPACLCFRSAYRYIFALACSLPY